MIRNVIILVHMVLFCESLAIAQSSVPEWTTGAVWYHIVPERYRNADVRNDPLKERVVEEKVKDWQIHPWASDWYKLQVWESPRDDELYDILEDRRYGGDLIGVGERIRYLRQLGVNALILTPVFESPSILKYDASTFHHIDNNFGRDRQGDWSLMASQREDPENWEMTRADELFLSLVEFSHEEEIKIVISASFGYCGRSFWAFQDVLRYQDESKYTDWFEILEWDDPLTPDTLEFDYKCWNGDKNLPLFRQDTDGLFEPVKKYIFDSTRRWMEPTVDGEKVDGIDGWCIRDGEALGSDFWKQWVDLVKSLNPDAVTILQNNIASDRYQEIVELFDLTASPDFMSVLNDFFIYDRITIAEFDRTLAELRAKLPEEKSQSNLHFVGNNETDRLGSRIVNAQRSAPTALAFNGSDFSDDYDPRGPTDTQRRVLGLLAFLQMTYVGSPVIYYGEEAGMWGGAGIDNLKPMLWNGLFVEDETYDTIRPDIDAASDNEFDVNLFRVYSKLASLREQYPAMRMGSFETWRIDDERGLYAFLRKHAFNEVLVIMNISENRHEFKLESPWEPGTKIRDVIRDDKFKVKDLQLTIDIPRMTGQLLVKEK